MEVSPELKQTLLHCQGDMHLAVIKWKIEHLPKIEIKFVRPRIAYRETIRRAGTVCTVTKTKWRCRAVWQVHLRIEPWFDGMPDPKDLNVGPRILRS